MSWKRNHCLLKYTLCEANRPVNENVNTMAPTRDCVADFWSANTKMKITGKNEKRLITTRSIGSRRSGRASKSPMYRASRILDFNRSPHDFDERVFEVMRGQQNRGALPGEFPQHVPDRTPAQGIQPDRGLVEEEDLRVRDQRHGDDETLTKTAGQVRRELVTVLPQAQVLHDFLSAFPGLCSRLAADEAEVEDVIVGRKEHLRPGLLRDHGDVRANRLRLRENVMAEDECAAHARLELGGEDPQERRLPRAVAAEQAKDLALLDREGNVLEGFRPSRVRFPKPFDADDLHAPRPTGASYLSLLRPAPRQLLPGGRHRFAPERKARISCRNGMCQKLILPTRFRGSWNGPRTTSSSLAGARRDCARQSRRPRRTPTSRSPSARKSTPCGAPRCPPREGPRRSYAITIPWSCTRSIRSRDPTSSPTRTRSSSSSRGARRRSSSSSTGAVPGLAMRTAG